MSLTRIPVSLALLVVLGVPASAGVDKVFTSPLKNFTVTIPKLQMGTKIEKSNSKESGHVAFLGGAGEIQRIDYVRVVNAPTDSVALGTRLDSVLAGFVTKANATLIEKDRATIRGTLVSFASASFPGAAAAVDMKTGKPMDAVRGMYSLVKGQYLYVLTAEPGGMFAVMNTPEQRSTNARRWLGEFLATITFQ